MTNALNVLSGENDYLGVQMTSHEVIAARVL